MPDSTNKLSAMTTAGLLSRVVCRKCRAYRNGLVLLLFAWAELFDVLKNGNSACLFGIMLHVKQTYLIVEYCKKSNFGQKTKRENGKKNKHRQKNYTNV